MHILSSLWTSSLLLFCTLTFPSTWALHESEAGVVDWQKSFIGVPRTDEPHVAPSFLRTKMKEDETTSLVISASGTVLGALDPVNGSIAWRHIFEPLDPIIGYYKSDNVVATLSGVGGSVLRVFDSLEGTIIHEKRLHHSQNGQLYSQRSLGVDLAFETQKATEDDQRARDLFVLTNGHTVHRMDGTVGELIWSWTAPEQTSLVILERLVVTDSTIYAIGLAKSYASYTLHVTALSAETGELLTTRNIPSSIQDGSDDFFALFPPNAEDPRLVWIEKGVVKSVALTPKLAAKPQSVKGSTNTRIIDVGLSEYGFFVAKKEDGSASVFKLNQNTIESIWDFADSGKSHKNADSMYTGGVDKQGNPYVGRMYWSFTLQGGVLHVFAPHLLSGKGLVAGYTFPFNTNIDGIISHYALDVVNPDGLHVLSRIVVTTTTGAVQLWLEDKLQWTREESLSTIALAEFVELPEHKAIQSSVAESENFIGRVLRHISDAQSFPHYLVGFVTRFATASYASVSAAISHDSGLYRDEFGFKKIIVAATQHGKMFGIDSSNGHVVWSRILGLGSAASVGGVIVPVKMFVVKSVSDGEIPQVVLLTTRRGFDDTVNTVVYHVNALTGQDEANGSPDGDILQGTVTFPGPPSEAFLLPSKTKTIVLLDSTKSIHFYPRMEENIQAFSELAPSLRFSLQTSSRSLHGYQFVPDANDKNVFSAHQAWSISTPNNELIGSIIWPTRGPIASLGKVLGDRTTLYKYLNPHLFAMTTVSKLSQNAVCSVYLVDGSKGSIIYHASVTSTMGPCSIEAVLTENWLVYGYYDDDFAGNHQTKGHRIVSVEVYEGKGINDKTRSSELSSLSEKALDVHFYERSFEVNQPIAVLATTSTKFGMTAKNIIIATKKNQIQSIPRRLLDPRRPKTDPTTQQQEEMLIKYDPVIPANPRLVISHQYEVANARKIITSPALLESTSLIFAYGLDLFGSRVTPSSTFDVLSESFNKAQLVLTIGGLTAAIAIAKPMVKRKKLTERWYQ